MERIAALESEIANLKYEYEKFVEKGNKSAGTRARKILQNIKSISQDIRIQIQEIKLTDEEE
jgi:hypothetical protein